VGGHLFWRDPAVGLLGAYASYTHWDNFGGLHATHVGVEGEYYKGPWTLQWVVGAESGNSKTAAGTRFDLDTRFFDIVDLYYYLTENSRVSVGHRYIGGRHALALGGEWAVPLAPKTMGSLFVEGRIGEDEYRAVWAGLRVYFGQRDKSLIRRNREDDDPTNKMPDTAFSILGTGTGTGNGNGGGEECEGPCQ
jgi:hypothetical protein